MGAHLGLIKEYLRGSNPRIGSVESMIKTTPPGSGSRLLRLDEPNPVFDRCARRVPLDEGAGGEVRMLATGPFTEADLGVACYHSKTGAVELYLNHLVDGPGEYVVVDMTAGADAFASGLFTRFDLTVLVSEPTRRGIGVYQQYAEHARGHGVALRVLGNKVAEAAARRGGGGAPRAGPAARPPPPPTPTTTPHPHPPPAPPAQQVPPEPAVGRVPTPGGDGQRERREAERPEAAEAARRGTDADGRDEREEAPL
jgi:hypothetical protein